MSLRHPYRQHRLLLPPKIGARPPPTNPQPFHPSTGAGGFSRVSTSAGLLDWTELEPKTRPAISSASKAAASFRYLVSCLISQPSIVSHSLLGLQLFLLFLLFYHLRPSLTFSFLSHRAVLPGIVTMSWKLTKSMSLLFLFPRCPVQLAATGSPTPCWARRTSPLAACWQWLSHEAD